MKSPEQHTHRIVRTLKSHVPGVVFKPGDSFHWSPETSVVSYNGSSLIHKEGVWSLIHEVAHAKLQHKNYSTDFELLAIEISAWEEAKSLAKAADVHIDEDYIQDCLDTYRDWLHKRSTCPTCGTVGLQNSQSLYTCYNCNQPWSVTTARFCRPYRRKSTVRKPSEQPDLPTFR
jgi:hypothetical protein